MRNQTNLLINQNISKERQNKKKIVQKKVVSNQDAILKEIEAKQKKREKDILKSMIPKAKEFIQ